MCVYKEVSKGEYIITSPTDDVAAHIQLDIMRGTYINVCVEGKWHM